MNESKFSLADLLIVLGAAGFGFFFYLSLNFLTLGETLLSIFWAVSFALLLGGLAFGAKILKKTRRNFKSCIIWELILLFLFAVVAFGGIFPFSHYITVVQKKAEIHDKAISNIEQAKGMFIEYDSYVKNRLNIYENRLKSVVAAKNVSPNEYTHFSFVNGTPDSVQVENKMFTLRAQLFPSNFEGEDGMKLVANNWLVNAKNTLENKWAFTFGIVEFVNNANICMTTWKDQLIQFSAFRAQGEIAEEFENQLTYDDVSIRITELNPPTLFSIALAISFYLLMLLSYFITWRHTRYPGLKVIFSTSGTKENEL